MNDGRSIRVKLICRIALVIWLAATVAGSAIAHETDRLPLSEPGPYLIGTRDMTFVDENRNGQEIVVTLWYPALEAVEDSAPDLSAAPYPAIVYSHGMYLDGGHDHRLAHASLSAHLASYGFVVAGVEHDDNDMALVFVDRPLDIMAVMDELSQLTDSDLAGLIDSERLGVMGMSGGTPTTLQLGGARVDWAYRDEWCTEHEFAYLCPPVESIPRRGREVFREFGVTDEDGLAYIPNDLHVRAIAAMSPGFAPLFGERGLATMDTPMLLMGATADETLHYQEEAVYIYDHVGIADRYLISFVGYSHRSLLFADPRRDHFMTAFFGYYLQGREEYAQYLTADYVNSIEGLEWGPYQAE
jgi:predicted dienelactone hydrolase